MGVRSPACVAVCVTLLVVASALGLWNNMPFGRRGTSSKLSDVTTLETSQKLATGQLGSGAHSSRVETPQITAAEQVEALRSQVAVLNAEVSELSSRNSELEAQAWMGHSAATCTERCAQLNRAGRWHFGRNGHECPDPVTRRVFCHCSHQANATEACEELAPASVRRLQSRRGRSTQSQLELDAGPLVGVAAAGSAEVGPRPRALQDEPARGSSAAPATPRELATTSDTVETFCNASGLVEMHGKTAEVTAAAGVLDPNELNQLESSILTDLSHELENNNVDKAARDIFTFYVCMRWVPDDVYWRLARQELAANLVQSVVDHKKHLDHAISELYQKYKYVPLLCSENYDVFGETDPEDHTHFRSFKKKMKGLSGWLDQHKKDDVLERLRKVDEIFCGGANMNDPSCNRGVAFDTWMSGATRSFGDWQWKAETVSDKWEAMFEIFQSFDPHQAKDQAWGAALAEWKSRFPFHSYIHKSDGMPPSESPLSDQRFLVCFGKRVASDLHRRPSGRYLLTDQNNIGCHGFWSVTEVTDMIARMVELWKPPTCQLAEMTFVMKKRLLSMYQRMNERLFDALPTLLMDEDLTKNGLLDDHIAGPPPFDRQEVVLDGQTFVDGMRVISNIEIKDPPGCKVPGAISGVFSGAPKCQLYVSKGSYGTVASELSMLKVRWDANTKVKHPVTISSDITVTPHSWTPGPSVGSQARDLVAGVGHIVDYTQELFDGMSRSRYTSLASLMSNSTSKWVVCPVRSDTNYSELDSQLGVEDAALREMQQEAYAKWTGFQGHLPGEVCVRPDFLPPADFPSGETCETAELHADHVEKYTNDDGSLEQFLCPVKQSLPADEQLRVLLKKGGQCFLHMTANQQRQYQWPYNGDYPARRQFDRKPNEPRVEFELIKLLNVPSRGAVAFARTCGPDQRAASPRFCRGPQLYNAWPSVAGAAKALLASVGGSFALGASAISQSVQEYRKTLSQNKNATELLGDTANLVGEQLWDQLTGAGRLLNSAVGSAVSAATNGLPGDAQRTARLEGEFFQESQAGLLLHTLSYQHSIGANAQTANAKERFQRYVVTMPCPDFDPAMEFALKKKWTTVALQMVQSAVRGGPEEVLEVPVVELALRGEGRLFARRNQQAQEDHWYTYGAAMQAVSSLGKAVSLPNCRWAWNGCKPSKRCTRSGMSCVPKVRLAPNQWWNVLDRQLVSVVAPSISDGNFPVTDLVGVTATLYCGRKDQFDDEGPGPAAHPSFLQCLKDGLQTNARLQAKEPWKVYWPDEVVVVAIFGTVTQRQCRALGHQGELCASGAEEAKDLDAHLTESERNSADGAYQGLHAGAGFPQGTPHEMVLRPEDVLEAAGLLSRG